jgi:hypothetical protein
MRATYILSLVMLVSAVGCGGESAPTPTAASGTTAATSAPATAADAAKVVGQFLEAVRLGQTDEAAKWLTPLALKRTTEEDLSFSPAGSATAKFNVGESEIVEADKAVVNCTWTDVDSQGAAHTEAIIWGLRMTPAGWRISGMAQDLGPEQSPIAIDFENPEAMYVDEAVKTPATTAGATATPGANQPSAEVAGNPFDQPAQR